MPEELASSTSGQPTPLDFSIQNEFSNYEEMPSKGYCRLFKAQRHGKWYVLKGLQPQHRADPLYMAMLEKEYGSAVRLDHPNIVRTQGIENDPVVGPCLVMDYVEGRTLSRFLSENPSRSLRKKVVYQLLDAMRYYHALQIIHRDLKPSNILITLNGNNVKVIDFGLADADDYAILKEPAYTQGYAAPEQMTNGAPIDCRTDIYSFGVLLRQLFPHRYRHIARRCTEKDPGKRYPDAAGVAQALHRSEKQAVALPILAAMLLLAVLWIVATRPISVESSDQQTDQAVVEPTHDSLTTAQSELPTQTATKSPTPPKYTLTIEQAKELLQGFSDSLTRDYKEQLDRGDYLSWLAAAQNSVKVDFCLQRYMYYLLAQLSVPANDVQYAEMSQIMVKATERRDQLVDSAGLPDYDKYNIPPACKAQEDAIIAETESMLTELVKLNSLYLFNEFDSIILCTKPYFPPIESSH